jgi:hypothetical protein
LLKTAQTSFFGNVTELMASPTPSWVMAECDLVISGETIETKPLHPFQVKQMLLALLSCQCVRMNNGARLRMLGLHNLPTFFALI